MRWALRRAGRIVVSGELKDDLVVAPLSDKAAGGAEDNAAEENKDAVADMDLD